MRRFTLTIELENDAFEGNATSEAWELASRLEAMGDTLTIGKDVKHVIGPILDDDGNTVGRAEVREEP